MNPNATLSEQVVLMLDKADRSLRSASILTNEGSYEFAISRAYYAAFYAVEAALITKELMTSSHKSILVLFNREFIHAGLLPQALNTSLNILFKERQNADYSYLASYTREEGVHHIEQAALIVREIRQHLTQTDFLPPPTA